MSRHYRRALAPIFAVAFAVAFPAVAQDSRHAVPGEKLDSGLGALPHYRDWGKHAGTRALVARTHAVPGEKLDSGLGELKPYRLWSDPTGRTREPIEVASRR